MYPWQATGSGQKLQVWAVGRDANGVDPQRKSHNPQLSLCGGREGGVKSSAKVWLSPRVPAPLTANHLARAAWLSHLCPVIAHLGMRKSECPR